MTERGLQLLKQEYQQYLGAYGRQGSEAEVFEFLNKRGALRDRAEMPGYVFGDYSHILIVVLQTDGDFSCDMKTPLLCIDESGAYSLVKGYEDPQTAGTSAIELLTEMKRHICTSREYIRKDIEQMFDDAIFNIEKTGGCYQCMYGNYDGTEIVFGQCNNGSI